MAKVKITYQQGQFLMNSSVGFHLAEKLGDDSYSHIDRSIAADEVRQLFKVLKSYSPRAQRFGKENRIWFGELDAWEEVKKDGEVVGGELKDPEREIELNLDDDAISGVMWCLVVALHPDAKEHRVGVALAENVVWPIAEQFGRVGALKDVLKLGPGSKGRRRWPTDSERLEKKEEEKK